VNESYLAEGAVKEFEMAIKNLINNIRRGYGWIDPEYVYDTVVNSSDFDRFEWETIKDEVYQRLIDNNLLYYANDADPETKGKKVSNVSQIQESKVNEGNMDSAQDLASFIQKEEKHFASFLKPKKLSANVSGNTVSITPASKSFTITVDFDKSTIDTTGKPGFPESVSYVELMEYVKITKFKIIGESVNEAKDEFVPANLTEDFEDLRKGDVVKINALEYTKGNDKETIESIRPDGKKMEIKKAILTVKI
jgi:hypothetical protein